MLTIRDLFDKNRGRKASKYSSIVGRGANKLH